MGNSEIIVQFYLVYKYNFGAKQMVVYRNYKKCSIVTECGTSYQYSTIRVYFGADTDVLLRFVINVPYMDSGMT